MKIKPTAVVSSSVSAPPLIKPDGRISRIRLSVAVHRMRCRGRPLCGATQCPLKRADLFLSLLSPKREPSHGPALCCSRRPSAVPSLQPRYEPSTLLRTAPTSPPAERASRVHRLCPPLGSHTHPGRSLHLFPPTFQTSRARRPRRASWTSRHFGLSDSSSGLPGSNPVSLHPSCRGSASRVFPVFGAHWMSFTFVTGCPLP